MSPTDVFRKFADRAAQAVAGSPAPVPAPPRETGTGHGTSQLIERLEASGDDPNERAAAWHQYLSDHPDEHAAAAERARHVVHRGNPEGVVALANELAAEHARHAASRMSRGPAHARR